MFKLLAVLISFALTVSALAASPQRVSFTSIDKARIGMGEQALARALGAPLAHAEPDAEEDGCYYAVGRGLPAGVGLMMLDGRLARIDVFEPGVRTVSGASVGMLEAGVKRIYGNRLIEEPHAYAGPEGHYLTLLSPDRTAGMRFETDGSVVTSFYAGTAEAIRYIEGCQ